MKRLTALLLAFALLLSVPMAMAEQAQEESPPPEIQRMIEIAREQFEKHGGKTLKKTNEYTVWYYGDKTAIGWCGAFTSWCAAQAGVTMLKEAQIIALVDGDDSKLTYEKIEAIPDVFMMQEVNIIRCRNAYIKADRLVDIPKPGYQIFYGRVGGAPTLHTGFVESVRLIEDGVYEITTLEGNVGSRVKRFCTRYTLEPKRKHRNFSVVPSKERVVENAQYKLHNADWYITGFGKTW